MMLDDFTSEIRLERRQISRMIARLVRLTVANDVLFNPDILDALII